MPIQGLIGLGTTGLAAAGVEGAAAASTMFFSGSWQADFGATGLNTYGARTQHIFGTDNKLLVGGQALGLLPILGIYINEFEGAGKWLGVGDDVRFGYGQSIDVVYGGPRSQITRGPIINRKTYRPLGGKYWPRLPIMPGIWNAVEKALNDILSGETSEFLAANHPSLPNPLQGAVMPEAFLEDLDEKYALPIFLLSQLVLLLTAAADLAVRFAYPEYNPQYDARDPSKPIPVPPGILLGVTGFVTNILQAVIYNFELISIYDEDRLNGQSEGLAALDKVQRLLSTNSATDSQNLIKWNINAAFDDTAVVVNDVVIMGMATAALGAQIV